MTNATTATDIPNDRDAALAHQAGRKLAEWGDGPDPVPARFGVAAAEPVAIPPSAVRLLKEILDHMARGNGVAWTT